MVEHWILWGLGWLLMPRMTIGILIATVLGNIDLGIVLGIIGGIIDISYMNR